MIFFSGKQIRNVAAVGGNIMTGSPISDLNPIFMASKCTLRIASISEDKQVFFDENFYTGYRKNIVGPSEILVSIKVPFTTENQFFFAYKQARRRDDDIAIVNGAFSVTLKNEGTDHVISSIRMAFGGMGPTTLLAVKSSLHLEGQKFNDNIVELACDALKNELSLTPNAPGAMIRYRQSLVLSFFFKTFLAIRKQLGFDLANENSAVEVFEKEPLHSHQLFEVKNDASTVGALGKPLKHKAADHQVAGTAQYTDDMPHIEGELYAGLVLSSKAHAEILSIDTSTALAVPGVVEWVDSTDLKERNEFALAITKDELVFANTFVHCYGMVIGVILAQDQETAQKAARLVKVEYKDLPAIITIEDAIKENSFHVVPNAGITDGDVESVFKSATNIVEGEMRTGAQEQFYLETQACIAIPKIENDEIQVWSSTQNPTLTQNTVAAVLGIPANR